MAGYAREATKRSKGGKFNKFVFVVKASDGTFSIPGSGTDPLGATYGTVHEAGSSLKTDWARDASGIWGIKYQIIEALTKWLNLWNLAAPAKADATKNETLELEDGTVLEGDTAGSSGDDTMPYAIFAHTRKVVNNSTEQPVLVFLGQFARTGGGSSEPGATAKLSFEANAVDGNGFTPNFGSDSLLGSVSFTPLSDEDRFGYWIDAAA